jgi:hypothetical protein
MSTIAVFATLAGGTAYAAVKITTRDIANGAVTTKKLANGAVTSPKIRNHTVAAGDLKQPEKFRLVGRAGQPQFQRGGQNDCIWSNLTSSTPPAHPFNLVGFYKDPYGVVHLTGAAQSVNGPGGDLTCNDTKDTYIYRLPEGYRPARVVAFSPAGGSGTDLVAIVGVRALVSGSVTVPAGTVFTTASGATSLTFDGMDFRAAGKATGMSSTRTPIHMSRKQLLKLIGG